MQLTLVIGGAIIVSVLLNSVLIIDLPIDTWSTIGRLLNQVRQLKDAIVT